MRKIIVTNIVSLDGYYEGPGRNVMVLPMDEAFDAYNLERMRAADAVLLGRYSYEGFSSYWPSVAENPVESPTHREFSRLYNKVEKVVVSNRMTMEDAGAWRDSTRIIGGEQVYDQIAELKHTPGQEIVVFGSRLLWNDLQAHGLVDELHFVVGNVVFGGGTPAFVQPVAYDDGKLSLRLIDTHKLKDSENALAQYAVVYKAL